MNSPEAIMRAQLYEQKYFANSALFATLVEDEFTKAGRTSEGVFQRDEGIRVLQATGMPSVLVEMGFLSNVEEEKYLNSEEGQNEIAHNLLEALRRYQATLEGHPINTADSTTSGSSAANTPVAQARVARPVVERVTNWTITTTVAAA